MWLNTNPFKKTLQDSLEVRHETDDSIDRLTESPIHSPIGLAEPAPESEYPSDETITQAFSELTAPAAPQLPDVPLKTMAKTFVKHRPWLLLPLLGLFPAIAWTTMPHPMDRTSIDGTSDVAAVSPTLSLTAPGLPVPNRSLSATPLPKVSPLTIAPAPTLTPVDLSKLTPEQKAQNAKAKAIFESTNAPVDAYVEMHVSIGKGSSIAFASTTALNLTDEKGTKLGNLAATQAHTAQFSGGGITIGAQSFPANTFIEPEPGGLLYLNNRPYRGKLLLSSDGSTLHAVNYINLRHYLYSVVASEVSPSWSPEAIKAQAVAARSYALTYYFKPVNSRYHIGSDEYFQVYSGTQREDDRSNQAVDITSGEYVSYKGGVVESLYAASDDIVAEAFAGRGMSQLGAKSLAEKGYKYDQILANYYPTTKVGKIAKDE
ncbi:MAG: SpoIID/LytB domain-containing protein [Alkalinema sp. CAN_BIN05]|nr:SpoIID/LytB domain-containing protein [Alkalinema sp. CAN_BIN05]